jgi:hypothetical protein
VSELSDEARALLAQVRLDPGDDPSAEDRARLRARLAATLALSTLGGTAASAALPETATAQLTSMALSTKVVVASLVVATAGAVAVGMFKGAEPTQPATVGAPSSAAPNVAPVPAETAAVVEAQTVAEDDVSAAPARKAAARRAQAESSVEPVTPPSLQAELALITAAQDALHRGLPRLALQRAREHATRFPQGVLVQERLGIDAVAACTLGERERGLQSLRALSRRAPSAPLLARARSACREPDAE